MSGVCRVQILFYRMDGGDLVRTNTAKSREAIIMKLSAGTAGGKPVCDVSLAPALDSTRSVNICSFLLDGCPTQTSRSGIINSANRMIEGNTDQIAQEAVRIYKAEGEPVNHGWVPRGIPGITANWASSVKSD